MRGPLWASATVQFNLELSDVKASAGVDLVDQSVFNLRRSSHNQAVLGLAKTIVGPQEIELLLNMEMYQNGDFSGIAVVKIFIYVTQYDFWATSTSSNISNFFLTFSLYFFSVALSNYWHD